MFVTAAQTHSEDLSNEERERFNAVGWLGPYPLLTAQGVDVLHRAFVNTGDRFSWWNVRASCERNDFSTHPWYKSLHAHLPSFREAVSQSAIVERLVSIVGPNIMAWGVSVTTRRPGQVHAWHIDIEHMKWDGVTAFIGLKNASAESSLKVISGSHRFNRIPQTLSAMADDEVLAAGRACDPECQLETIDIREGEFFVFHGKIWHGSHNTGQSVRTAIIAQYSSPGAEIAIPRHWEEPLSWHPYRPPCVLVRGVDLFGRNHIVNHTDGAAGSSGW